MLLLYESKGQSLSFLCLFPLGSMRSSEYFIKEIRLKKQRNRTRERQIEDTKKKKKKYKKKYKRKKKKKYNKKKKNKRLLEKAWYYLIGQ